MLNGFLQSRKSAKDALEANNSSLVDSLLNDVETHVFNKSQLRLNRKIHELEDSLVNTVIDFPNAVEPEIEEDKTQCFLKEVINKEIEAKRKTTLSKSNNTNTLTRKSSLLPHELLGKENMAHIPTIFEKTKIIEDHNSASELVSSEINVIDNNVLAEMNTVKSAKYIDKHIDVIKNITIEKSQLSKILQRSAISYNGNSNHTKESKQFVDKSVVSLKQSLVTEKIIQNAKDTIKTLTTKREIMNKLQQKKESTENLGKQSFGSYKQSKATISIKEVVRTGNGSTLNEKPLNQLVVSNSQSNTLNKTDLRSTTLKKFENHLVRNVVAIKQRLVDSKVVGRRNNINFLNIQSKTKMLSIVSLDNLIQNIGNGGSDTNKRENTILSKGRVKENSAETLKPEFEKPLVNNLETKIKNTNIENDHISNKVDNRKNALLISNNNYVQEQVIKDEVILKNPSIGSKSTGQTSPVIPDEIQTAIQWMAEDEVESKLVDILSRQARLRGIDLP